MKNRFSSVLIIIFILMTASVCAANQQVPVNGKDSVSLPGKWLNEGEQTTLFIKDDLTCVLKYTDYKDGDEVGNLVEIKGKAKIKGPHITIDWGKGYWYGTQTEYEYRDTGKQLVLWIIGDNLKKSHHLPKGGKFGFYKDEPYFPKLPVKPVSQGDLLIGQLPGKWFKTGDRIALVIHKDLSCALKYEEGQSGETVELKGKAKITGDKITIKWENNWRYGDETTYEYRTAGPKKLLWMVGNNNKSYNLPKGGQLGFEKDENRNLTN